VKINRRITRRVRSTADGVNAGGVNTVADVNVTIAANVGESARATASSASTASSHHHVEIVQRGGHTEVHDFDSDPEPRPDA